MPSRFTEYLEEQVGSAVDDFRLIGEAGRRCDISIQLDALTDLPEIARSSLQDRKSVDHYLPGVIPGLVERDGFSDPSGPCQLAVSEGKHPAHENKITRPDV